MSSWRSRVAFPLLAYAFTAIMMGTTLPTPMYALYSAKMHFSVLTTTVVFATYAGGVLAALLVMGPWSDAVGRARYCCSERPSRWPARSCSWLPTRSTCN
ncbi:MAG: hypothetical protein QOJ20_1207 [Mycobacterium sp.]|nr:hypothetical protein [Mycobacterium sp.]